MEVIHSNSPRQPPRTLSNTQEIPNAKITVADPTTQSGSTCGTEAAALPWATIFPTTIFTRERIPKTPRPAVNKIDSEAITAAGSSAELCDGNWLFTVKILILSMKFFIRELNGNNEFHAGKQTQRCPSCQQAVHTTFICWIG